MQAWWMLLIGTGLSLAVCESEPQSAGTATLVGAAPPDTAAFSLLLRRLRHHSVGDPLLPAPVIYRDSSYDQDRTRRLQFELCLADQPLQLSRRVVRLTGHGNPVCYSVVFDNCLVALFKNGKFGCYRLPDLTRDEQLERQLNFGSWRRCWLLGGQLVAQNSKGYFAYGAAARAWQPYERPVPLGQRPKLFEDGRYLAYASCHGEFGGTVAFYNKQTGQTHVLAATCANSVWQESGQYRVLASLGHMMGSAGCVALTDPEQLPRAATAGQSQWLRAPAPPPRVVTDVFDFYGLQLFGGFRRESRTLYLMHWRRATFLVTVDGPRITIVDPLFADDLYTFNPITTAYGPGLTLTNLNSNDEPETTEVAALLWQGQQLTRVEWSR